MKPVQRTAEKQTAVTGLSALKSCGEVLGDMYVYKAYEASMEENREGNATPG